MAKNIIIGKEEFETAYSCMRECRARISKYKAGEHLDSKDFVFFKQVLALHPDREEKLGCGISSLKYDWHGSYNTKCLIIIRHDGTEQPVSWQSSLQKPTAKHQVQQAFRTAAEGYVNLLKAAVVFKHQNCFLSGEKLGLNNSRAIYSADLSFNELVAEFLWCLGLEYRDVILHYHYGRNCPALIDEVLMKKWQAFHEEMAVITLISNRPEIHRKGSQAHIIKRQSYA